MATSDTIRTELQIAAEGLREEIRANRILQEELKSRKETLLEESRGYKALLSLHHKNEKRLLDEEAQALQEKINRIEGVKAQRPVYLYRRDLSDPDVFILDEKGEQIPIINDDGSHAFILRPFKDEGSFVMKTDGLVTDIHRELTLLYVQQGEMRRTLQGVNERLEGLKREALTAKIGANSKFAEIQARLKKLLPES